MNKCPCGSDKNYTDCCEPLIKGERSAQTAEELMRSRYTAYTKAEVDHILKTSHPDKQDDYDRKSVLNWAKNSDWIKLDIIDTDKGGPENDDGQVEFKAHYRKKGERQVHHELATFKKVEGEWYFFDGETPTPQQVVRSSPKVGRNDPCPCKSGKKYKKCCGK